MFFFVPGFVLGLLGTRIFGVGIGGPLFLRNNNDIFALIVLCSLVCTGIVFWKERVDIRKVGSFFGRLALVDASGWTGGCDNDSDRKCCYVFGSNNERILPSLETSTTRCFEFDHRAIGLWYRSYRMGIVFRGFLLFGFARRGIRLLQFGFKPFPSLSYMVKNHILSWSLL